MMNQPRLSNPDFKYTSSAETDIRVTFERIRMELAEKANARKRKQKAKASVTPIKRKASR